MKAKMFVGIYLHQILPRDAVAKCGTVLYGDSVRLTICLSHKYIASKRLCRNNAIYDYLVIA